MAVLSCLFFYFCGSHEMSFLAAQYGLPHADGKGRHLHQFIFPYKADGLLQGHGLDGGEEHVVVLSGGPHVGELFFLGGVNVDVLTSVVFPDDHPLVDRLPGRDEESAAGFQIKKGIGDGVTCTVGHDGPGKPAGAFSSERLITVEQGVHDASPLACR